MTLYEILGIPADAGPRDIRNAHRAKVKTLHPDAGGTAEEFHAVQSAYAVLSDPEKRARYDATGECDQAPEHDPVFGKVCAAIAQMLQRFIEDASIDIEATSLTAKMLGIVENDVTAMKAKIEEVDTLIGRAEAISKRFTVSGEGPDVVAGALGEQIAGLQTMKRMLSENLEVADKLREIVGRYGYEFVAKPKPEWTPKQGIFATPDAMREYLKASSDLYSRDIFR